MFNSQEYKRMVAQGRKKTLDEAAQYEHPCAGAPRTVADWYASETDMLDIAGSKAPACLHNHYWKLMPRYNEALTAICAIEKTYLWHASAYQRAMAWIMVNK